MAPFVKGSVLEKDLESLTREAYSTFTHTAVAPLKQLAANDWLVELFHGPTAAFKDFGARFLAATLNSSIGDHQGSVSLNLLSKDLAEGLAILREVLTKPRFQQDRLDLHRQQAIAAMKQRNDDSTDIEARERERLSFGEITRLARLFVALGVRKLRLTGGEPLLRAGLPELIGDLAALPRDDLVRRLGAEGLALWQRATGGATRPLHLVVPAQVDAAKAKLDTRLRPSTKTPCFSGIPSPSASATPVTKFSE